ncbi:MAG: channel protein TolC [Rubrivivax sp.]|nr:MAG: channel protein TolC [Rubrivivax sp.]
MVVVLHRLRRNLAWCACLFVLPGLAWAQQSLPELYQQALGADPAYTGVSAQRRVADERVIQARAGFLPTVAYTASESRSHYTSELEHRPFATRQSQLQFTQPLVKASALSTWNQQKEVVEATAAQVQGANLDVMQRLVTAYFEVLSARDNLALTRGQKEATTAQLAVAKRSFTVGTVSVTDVREAEAKLDTIAAQESAAEYELVLKQELLEQLVGQKVESGRALTPDSALPTLLLADNQLWLDEAEDSNPQVVQARHALEAARLEIDTARGAHVPSVDFTASMAKTKNTGTSLTASQQDGRTRQFGVNLNVPLFSGLATQSKVREALAQHDKARSDLDGARKSASLAVRQAFYATLSALSQVHGLGAAERSADTAVRANRRGYEVGLRINADVLNAQSQLYQTRRDLSKARYDAWVNYVKLLGAAGKLSVDDLQTLDQALKAPAIKPEGQS